jgi:hypothetical protein
MQRYTSERFTSTQWFSGAELQRSWCAGLPGRYRSAAQHKLDGGSGVEAKRGNEAGIATRCAASSSLHHRKGTELTAQQEKGAVVRRKARRRRTLTWPERGPRELSLKSRPAQAASEPSKFAAHAATSSSNATPQSASWHNGPAAAAIWKPAATPASMDCCAAGASLAARTSPGAATPSVNTAPSHVCVPAAVPKRSAISGDPSCGRQHELGLSRAQWEPGYAFAQQAPQARPRLTV